MTGAEAESLNHRIRNAASRDGIPPIRLRNRIAFQRILARLALDGIWVLKGGFSLEVRLGLQARATRDLDLLKLGGAPTSAVELQELLDEALDVGLDDGFAFRVRLPRPVRVEEVEPSTWRVVVDVRYAGAEFGSTTIDIVPGSREAASSVEPLLIEAVVVGEAFTVQAIDVNRHAAEKLHAYSRLYAYDRPSSRVKDLVDIVLLVESDLLALAPLGSAIRAVFAERNTELPDQLSEPPRDWARTYTALALETGTDITDVDAASRVAAELYRHAIAQEGSAR